jgi:uncharacterized protein
MVVRELRRADWPAALALNLASERELSPLDEARLEWILTLARSALGVEQAGELVGFAVAIAQDSGYDSENYRWFAGRYERFLYLDRIAVAEGTRRRGVATLLYDAMEEQARALERMVCEVNLEPANPASLAFHAARGYVEVGRLAHGEEKLVALLAKELAATREPL